MLSVHHCQSFTFEGEDMLKVFNDVEDTWYDVVFSISKIQTDINISIDVWFNGVLSSGSDSQLG